MGPEGTGGCRKRVCDASECFLPPPVGITPNNESGRGNPEALVMQGALPRPHPPPGL